MGGLGSGAWPSSPVIEDFAKLDVRSLARAGVLESPGPHRWPVEDGLGNVLGGIHVCGGNQVLLCSYVWAQTRETVATQVSLDDTPCHFGGSRRWFLCPECRRRAAILYFDDGALTCRRCLGAVYLSTRERPLGRAALRARRARRRLGSGSVDAVPERPRNMRWATYLRLAHRVYAADRELQHAAAEEARHLASKYQDLLERTVVVRAHRDKARQADGLEA